MGIRNKTSVLSVLHGLVYTHPSMAAHLPCLPGSLHISVLVLTSFVPPAHNQGVSLAPCQGLALWKIFLPTTGSFFVNITFTDWLPRDSAVPSGRSPPTFCLSLCFTAVLSVIRSIPGVAEVNRQFSLYLAAHFNHVSLPSDSYSLSSYAACTPLSGLLISPSIFSPS